MYNFDRVFNNSLESSGIKYHDMTLAIVPGSFKPPHKGHWEMVLEAMKNSDKVLILISNISEKVSASRPISKTNLKAFGVIVKALDKLFVAGDRVAGEFADKLKNYIEDEISPSFTEFKDFLLKISEEFPEIKEKINEKIDNLQTNIFKNIRRTSLGTEITPEVSKKIFEIFIRAYGVQDRVSVEVSTSASPIISAFGIVNHECHNCKVLMVVSKKGGDDARFSDLKQTEEGNNEIESFPVDVKTNLSATTLRNSVENLQREWFPDEISDRDFEEIQELLSGEVVTEESELDTKRKPIQKIDAMGTDEMYDFTDDDGNTHKRYVNFRNISMTDNGFMRNRKTFRGKKGGIVKMAQKISAEEFGRDPQAVLDELFGAGKYTPNDLSSFEKIRELIASPDFPYKDRLKRIQSSFLKKCEKYKERNPSFEIPELELPLENE